MSVPAGLLASTLSVRLSVCPSPVSRALAFRQRLGLAFGITDLFSPSTAVPAVGAVLVSAGTAGVACWDMFKTTARKLIRGLTPVGEIIGRVPGLWKLGKGLTDAWGKVELAARTRGLRGWGAVPPSPAADPPAIVEQGLPMETLFLGMVRGLKDSEDSVLDSLGEHPGEEGF